MKDLWNKINGKVKIAVLVCCTLIGSYGILKAPASDQSQMEQELKDREKELMKADIQTTIPDKTQQPKESVKEEQTMSVIADSVFLGASSSFQKLQPNAVIDAKVSRQVRHGLDVAKKLNKKEKLGNIVILSLGTNSPFNPVTGQELIDYLGTDRTIYWINAYGKNLEYQEDVNKTIKELADKNDNVHLISWAKEAKKHPGWFYQDGTHLNTKGQDGFAKFIWREINTGIFSLHS